MADRHLNLFYTYNRDTELIEDNLTRAFIVFLSIISGKARNRLLGELFEGCEKASSLDFSEASFALQGNIERSFSRGSKGQILLTIATERLDTESDCMTEELSKGGSDGAELRNARPSSRPDGWIYDGSEKYCILIESKVNTYPLDLGQLQAHARDWLVTDLKTLSLEGRLYSLTWIDVLRTLTEVHDSHGMETTEKLLLSHMIEFIRFFGYRLFEGSRLDGLENPPEFVLSGYCSRAIRDRRRMNMFDIRIYDLEEPPQTRLNPQTTRSG